MAGWSSYPAQAATNGTANTAPMAELCGFSPTPSPAKAPGKRLRLESGSQIRREIVNVYRSMKAGLIDVNKGTKLVYTLEVLSRAVEREGVERLAERLDAMEGR